MASLRLCLAFVLCVIGGFFSVVDASSRSAVVPLFLWSGQPYFGEQHSIVQQMVGVDDIASLFGQMTKTNQKPSALSAYLSGSSKPEVILAFVYPQLSSSDVTLQSGGYSQEQPHSYPLSSLKTLLSSSRSSLSVPFVSLDPVSSSVSQHLISTLSQAPSRTKAAQIEGGGVVGNGLSGCDALLHDIQEDVSIFQNGITDLILVHYHHEKDRTGCMTRLLDYVDDHTSNFIGVVSADRSQRTPILLELEDLSGPSDKRVFLETIQFDVTTSSLYPNATNGSYPGVLNANADSLFVVLLGFFLVFILLMAVNCLMSVETPPRFTTIPLQISKEY